MKHSQGPSSHYSLRVKTATVAVLLWETPRGKAEK